MKKVLITGFEPFGDYKFNPTMDIVDWNNGRTITGAEEIIGMVLPATYFGPFLKVSKFIDEEKPDAIISLGLSSSIHSIRIETLFRNKMFSKYSDARGYKPNGVRIDKSIGSTKTLTPLIETLMLKEQLMNNGIVPEISKDAGTFICNSLGYQITKKITDQNLPIKYIFIHIPWTDDYKSRVQLEPGKIFLEKEVVYNAIDILIKYI